MVAVRDAAGNCGYCRAGATNSLLKEWLAADADARSPKDQTLSEGTRCDANGCVATAADGGRSPCH